MRCSYINEKKGPFRGSSSCAAQEVAGPDYYPGTSPRALCCNLAGTGGPSTACTCWSTVDYKLGARGPHYCVQGFCFPHQRPFKLTSQTPNHPIFSLMRNNASRVRFAPSPAKNRPTLHQLACTQPNRQLPAATRMKASRFSINESLLLLSDSAGKRQEEKAAEGGGRPFSAIPKAVAFQGILACTNPPNYGGTLWMFEQAIVALQVC